MEGQRVGSQVLVVIPPGDDSFARRQHAGRCHRGLDRDLRRRHPGHPEVVAASSAGSRVPVEERLFSLVLALLATETGLTKNEILSTVQGYRQRYKSGGDNANLERQFERDKDDIRELGVPLETVDSPGDAGNNQTLRYRIPRGAYELPARLSFSSDETTLLNLAAMVWREGSLSGESRRALLKLRSLGVDRRRARHRLRAARAAARCRLRPAEQRARAALIVRFPYLKPGEDAAREREVLPLALVQYQGRWHLSAEETDFGTRRPASTRCSCCGASSGRSSPASPPPRPRATRRRWPSPASRRSGSAASPRSRSAATPTPRRGCATAAAPRRSRSRPTAPPAACACTTSTRRSCRRARRLRPRGAGALAARAAGMPWSSAWQRSGARSMV